MAYDVLTTPRLTLTPPAMADFEDSAALWGDPVVVRYIGGKTSTRSEAWARFQRLVGGGLLLGYGSWVVRERETGRFVGEVGFADYKREITPRYSGTPEAGWVLATWAHGRGYATEAVTAAHAWGDKHFQGWRTVCVIDVENAASLGVARKLGYTEIARTELNGGPVVVLERLLPGRLG